MGGRVYAQLSGYVVAPDFIGRAAAWAKASRAQL